MAWTSSSSVRKPPFPFPAVCAFLPQILQDTSETPTKAFEWDSELAIVKPSISALSRTKSSVTGVYVYGLLPLLFCIIISERCESIPWGSSLLRVAFHSRCSEAFTHNKTASCEVQPILLLLMGLPPLSTSPASLFLSILPSLTHSLLSSYSLLFGKVKFWR